MQIACVMKPALGETGLQVGLAARRVLLGTPFFLHVPK
jgi:hypothetical protein